MALPKQRTELEAELTLGVDPKTRVIHFGNPLPYADDTETNSVEQMSVEMTIRAIHRMESDHRSKPITIKMNSYGGDPYAMLYLYDVIQSSNCQFKFIGGGVIMSSATWIMAGCDERYLYPNTTVMIHNGSEELKKSLSRKRNRKDESKYDDLHIFADESKRLMDRLYDIYAENSIMDRDFYVEACKRDLYLNAQETIQLGLADEIIEPVKRGNLRRKRAAHFSKKVNSRAMKSLVNKLFKRINISVSVKDIHVSTPVPDEIDPNIIIDETPVPDEIEEPVKESTD